MRAAHIPSSLTHGTIIPLTHKMIPLRYVSIAFDILPMHLIHITFRDGRFSTVSAPFFRLPWIEIFFSRFADAGASYACNREISLNSSKTFANFRETALNFIRFVLTLTLQRFYWLMKKRTMLEREKKEMFDIIKQNVCIHHDLSVHR